MKLSLEQAIFEIKNHNIVALPTETVYGLFGLATSQSAVKKVFLAKNRPPDNPLICHFHSVSQILEYVDFVPNYFDQLTNAFWPGPMTVLLPLKPNSILSPTRSGLSTITCRIPNHPMTLGILRQINVPLFGPSANTSTKVSGVFAEMIESDLGKKIAGIVDGGMSKIGLESTILNCLKNDSIEILRIGVVGKKELQEALPNIQIKEKSTLKITTPGSKYKHYSPNTIIKALNTTDFDTNFCIIGLEEDLKNYPNRIKLNLGSKTNLQELASKLFFNLYNLDKQNQKESYFLYESFDFLKNDKTSFGKAIFSKLSKIII
jgi:L-threonylcarbamoyladenylate synthase